MLQSMGSQRVRHNFCKLFLWLKKLGKGIEELNGFLETWSLNEFSVQFGGQ